MELRVSTSSQTPPYDQSTDEETAKTLERLLSAIDRLRGERDGLRRDLEFLNVEHRFTVQALEEKLSAATSTTPVTPAFNTADLTALEGHIQAFQDQVDRSALATTALAVVAQHVGEAGDVQTARVRTLEGQLHSANERLAHLESLLQEREHAVASLNSQLLSASGSLGATGSQTTALRSTIERLEHDLANERGSHAETGTALADTESQLRAISEALSEAEAARDALALEKTHLETDLANARDELEDAEARHAEQLAAVSAASQQGHGAHAALRAQVRELEERILRRTEQIGVHQHDIKRMELNMKLQEERIAEMTQDLEVHQSEKMAMLEDCRTTREERDEARQRCEDLEEAMEVVEEQREREVEALVRVTFAAATARRDICMKTRRALTASSGDRALLEERISVLENEKADLASRIQGAILDRDQLAQKIASDLSATQIQADQASAASQVAEEARLAAESQVTALRAELESKDRELTSVQKQLAAVQASHVDQLSLDTALFAQEKAALESQLEDAQATREGLETRCKQTADELQRVEQDLKRAKEELAGHLANNEVQTRVEEQLRVEIVQVKEQHVGEIASLEDKLRTLSEELDAVTRARRETDASLASTQEELSRTKAQLETRLAEVGQSVESATRLEAELKQLKDAHAEEIRGLRHELDTTTAQLQDATERKDELEALHHDAVRNAQDLAADASSGQQRIEELEATLAQLRASHATEIQDLQTRLEDADKALTAAKADADVQQRDAIDELTRTIEDLQTRLTALTKEADEYRMELDEEKEAHARTRDSTAAELQDVTARHNEAEAALADAQKAIPELRAQLEHLESALHDTEEEKLTLQYQATNLEAEIQRAKSLQRFLESQVADGYVSDSPLCIRRS